MARKKDNEPLLDGEGNSARPLKMNAGFQYEFDLIRALRDKGFDVSDPAGADNAKAVSYTHLTLPTILRV